MHQKLFTNVLYYVVPSYFIWLTGLSGWMRSQCKRVLTLIAPLRVRTPVALLRLLSGKYHWERYEPPYPPSYGLNSTTTVLLGEKLWH